MPSCSCTTPPGGGGQCPAGSVAVCRVSHGECKTECSEPSHALFLLGTTAVANWLLGVVLEEERPPQLELSDREVDLIRSLLSSESIQTHEQVISVGLPPRVKAALRPFDPPPMSQSMGTPRELA